MKRERVIVVSELFYPDESATGYLLTKIARGLSEDFDVEVLSGPPPEKYAWEGSLAAEQNGNLKIYRCLATRFDKASLIGRTVNLVTVSFFLFIRSLFLVRNGDIVLVVTNPPILPFMMAITSRIRHARCALLVHDVFPDALVSAEILSPDSLFVRWYESMNRKLYRRMAGVIVIGHDMERIVARKLPPSQRSIVMIPNWADLDEIRPSSKSGNPLLQGLHLTEKFIVSYAGNMGRTHGLEMVVQAIDGVGNEPDIHFLFIGSGVKRKWMAQEIIERHLANVTLLEPMARGKQQEFLNACDVGIISFVKNMQGISVPSRLYNILAAGKYIIGVTDRDSELASVIINEKVGWVVEPGDVDGLIEAIREARTSSLKGLLSAERARAVAEKYSFARSIEAYKTFLHGISRQPEQISVHSQ